MTLKTCKACGRKFHPHPQTPKQEYCSAPECRLERRRRSQQKKRRDDQDYRQNDADHNTRWSDSNPDYWKQYRAEHADYVERNRQQQKNRNQRRRNGVIANEDLSAPFFPLPSGRYRITRISPDGIANEDSWIVEITVLASGYSHSAADCKVKP